LVYQFAEGHKTGLTMQQTYPTTHQNMK